MKAWSCLSMPLTMRSTIRMAQFMSDVGQFQGLFDRVGVDLEKEFLQTEIKDK